MADVPNRPGSLELIIFMFPSASITRLGIFYWHQLPHMLDIHIVKRFNITYSYFGPLKHHFLDLTQCPNKPGTL
jgi:hypothetical protein